MGKIAKSQLTAFVRSLLGRLPASPEHATVLALSGNLGAGKTTFVQALGKELGIQEPMQSPTYVLMKSYPIVHPDFTTLIHIDAYRLESPAQFAVLTPKEFLNNPRNLVCIEWPERVEEVLPPPDLFIDFSSERAGEGERYIEVANPRV